MDLSIRLVTRPVPGIWTRTVILVIIVIAVLVIRGTGYDAAAAGGIILGVRLLGDRGHHAPAGDPHLLAMPAADPGRAA